MLTVLRRLFDFSDWQTAHPGQPPPGDMIDASFDAQNQRIMELESLLADIRRSDGRLRNGIVSKDSLDPDFFVQLSAKIAQIGEILLESARLERQNAENAANVAIFAKNTAEEAKQRVIAAETAAEPFHSTLQTGLQTLSEQVEIARTAASQAVAALDVVEEMESHAGYSEAWADSSQAWAEHMPDTIPDNYLHDTDISGDHWSSRWWANKAAHSFGMLVEFYLGAHEDPPTTGLDGGPIDPGSIYYDTDDGRAYVWNGSAWVPLWTPAQTNTLSLWYVATAAQTAFPTSTPDINGNSFVLDNANPEGVEVHVNGLLKEPDLSGPGGDYTIDTGSSTVTFNAGLAAGDRVCIDVMMSPADMRPGAMNAWAVLVSPPPGGGIVDFQVTCIDPTGPDPVTAAKAEELLVSVDGVVQKPGDDYQAAGDVLTFTTAPAADSVVFATWFQALGGSPTGDMTPAEILAAIKTVDGPASGLDADLLDGQHGAFYAPIASPTFTGDPKAPTPATADNDTSIATTAFVVAKLAASGVGGAPAWADITGKPSTFPPTVPIAQADITNLTTDLTAKANVAGQDFTGRVLTPGGSAADPGLTVGTTGYGLYQTGTALNLIIGGAARMAMASTSMTSLVQHRFQYGTAAAPGVAFQSQTSTGIWGATGTVSITTTGVNRLSITDTTATWTVPERQASGAVGAPAYSWTADTDAGFYLSAAGDMRLSMAGADVVKWLDDKSTTFSGQVLAAVGTGALPGISTAGFPDTGINATSNSALTVSVGGSTRMTFGTTTASVGSNVKLIVIPSNTTRAGLWVQHGVAPTTPSDGDFWSTSAGGFYGRVNGVTKNLSIHVGTTAPASPITNDLWLDTN